MGPKWQQGAGAEEGLLLEVMASVTVNTEWKLACLGYYPHIIPYPWV